MSSYAPFPSLRWCRSGGASVPTLLSVPDMESLNEITDRDVQGLLLAMTSPQCRPGRAAVEQISVVDETTKSTQERSPVNLYRPLQNTVSLQHEQQRLCGGSFSTPQTSMPGITESTTLRGQQPVSLPMAAAADAGGPPMPHSDLHRPLSTPPEHGAPFRDSPAKRATPTQHATTTSSPSPPLPLSESPKRMARNSRDDGGGLPPTPSPAPPPLPPPPRLLPISDTEMLEAERQRWGSQLVQESWLHQELHGLRWSEELLQYGAAYRPRAIASRTSVSMTRTMGLCIVLNIKPSLLENANEALGAARGEKGEGEGEGEETAASTAGMPSMNSREAEAWAPLFTWRSPAFILGDSNAILSQLSDRLREQYEGFAPRPLPTTSCANARPSDLIQTLTDLRKQVGDSKIIFHYLARGVPPPRGGCLHLVNTLPNTSEFASSAFKISLDTFRSRVGFPLVFVADCAEAGEILNYYIRMCEEQHQQRYFTSSREYQLKLSQQVSDMELDNPGSDYQGGRTDCNSDRAGSNADMGGRGSLWRGSAYGSSGGLGSSDGLDGISSSQRAMLQDFYFIGASGSSSGNSDAASSTGGVRSAMGRGAEPSVMADAGRSVAAVRGVGLSAQGRGEHEGDAGVLRHHPRLPSDILTSCLTTPLRMALLWFIAERPELPVLHPLLLHLLPGTLSDKKTPLGQLQWYLQSITECIAWSTLSLPQYSRLFREDIYVAPLFRGYLLAERIIVGGLGGFMSVYPPIPATHSHALWNTWDSVVERAYVSLLHSIHPAPPCCASVLEFRSWLDMQVTLWMYSHPDLPAQSDGWRNRLSILAEDTLVVMPPLLQEELSGMQAILDGITQQSFELPRGYLTGVWGLQQGSEAAIAARGIRHDTIPGSWEGGGWSRLWQRAAPACAADDSRQEKKKIRAARIAVRELADRYSNPLRSSYRLRQRSLPPAPTSPSAGSRLPTRSLNNRAAMLNAAGRLSVGERGDGATQRSVLAVSRTSLHRGHASTGRPYYTRRAALENPNLLDPTIAVTPTTSVATTGHRSCDAGAFHLDLPATTHSSTTAVAGAQCSMKDTVAASERNSTHLVARKSEYQTNIYTNTSTSGQAASFHYTSSCHAIADVAAAADSGKQSLTTHTNPSLVDTVPSGQQPPPPPHTFPFMERMPLLLQALLVAAHREKATELVCRLVDCGPAAVLQCAEANIYRLVLDRYWSRPDLRFLMPATLFIFCKSCYADPELIGPPKQRDAAVKACADILQCPVEISRSATVASGAEETPGWWQHRILGPYATPYGQRMMAASLLTLLALHSDDGREACHQCGVFQLCCQLLQHSSEEAPLWQTGKMAEAAASVATTATATPVTACGSCGRQPGGAPPLMPRAPSSPQRRSGSLSPKRPPRSEAPSPLVGHENTSAKPLSPSSWVLPPPPTYLATTYHLTLLTLLISLLCDWKLPPASGAVEAAGEDSWSGDSSSDPSTALPDPSKPSVPALLHPPLDGTVQEVPPTSADVIRVGLDAIAPALMRFVYSDTSVLRGAALRCLMMALISPAPSVVTRARFVELFLHRLYGVPVGLTEVNADLRLEVVRVAYTAYHWLFTLLQENMPTEEIGQFVAVWMYRWFQLAAKGRTPPPAFIFGDKSNRPGCPQRPGDHRGGRPLLLPHHLLSLPVHGGLAPAGVSTSYRATTVITPGSVYSHRRSNVPAASARSVRASAMKESASDGGAMACRLLDGGLRHHVAQQRQRRLEACLPPFSNLICLFFQYTQDACPRVRTYARRVVQEEFSFLRQSRNDDYAVRDPQYRSSQSPVADEDDYSSLGCHHPTYHDRPSPGLRSHHRHHAPRHEGSTGFVGSLVAGASYVMRPRDSATHQFSSIPSASSAEAAVLGGAVTRAPSSFASRDGFEEMGMRVTAVAMDGEPEDAAEPDPVTLTRFIGQLLRTASSTCFDGTTTLLTSPYYFLSLRLGDDEEEGGEGARDAPRGRSAYDAGGDSDAPMRESPERHDSPLPAHHTRLGDNVGRGGESEDIYFASALRRSRGVGGQANSGGADVFLDAEAFALNPLWTLDSTSVTTFAYGALRFLGQFMLEEKDDTDPRHPMNLEKGNALYGFLERVERNIRASALDTVVLPEFDSVAPQRKAEGVAGVELSKTAGSGASTSPTTPQHAYATFHYLGEGDIRAAAAPAYDHGSASAALSSPTYTEGGRRADERGVRDMAALPFSSHSYAVGEVAVILFHPSEPIVVTSTTGGLVSVWSYERLGVTGAAMDVRIPPAQDSGMEGEDAGEAGRDAGAGRNDRCAATTPRRTRAGFDVSPQAVRGCAHYFLRDVVGRPSPALSRLVKPRYMYDRYNPSGALSAQGAGVAASRRLGERPRQRTQQSHSFAQDARFRRHHPETLTAAEGVGIGSSLWTARAGTAKAPLALPSFSQLAGPHNSYSIGELHLVDAAHRPLLCAVRCTGAVALLSDFADGSLVRRVTTFETQHDHGDKPYRCVSSYQPPTGLLYVATRDGCVDAWDLGSEQRFAVTGALASHTEDPPGPISALMAHPCEPYEYVVGSRDASVCLFDLRDGATGAARCGVSAPSLQLRFDGGSAGSSCSPAFLRVGYLRRYPYAVMAGYSSGVVAVWDRRYTREPCLAYSTEVCNSDADASGASCRVAPRTIHQLDIHSSSRRLLTLAATATSFQLMQPSCVEKDFAHFSGNVRSDEGVGAGAGGSLVAQRRYVKASMVKSYSLGGDGEGETGGLRAACFHDSASMLGVGIGSTLRIYGTTQSSLMMAYLNSDAV